MVFVDVEDDTEIKKETDQKESMADEEIGADIKKETDQVRLIDYIQIIWDSCMDQAVAFFFFFWKISTTISISDQ